MNIENEIIFSLKKIQENTELFAPNIDGELSISQIHCISIIGDNEDANVTKISNELEMTTGAITKMCKKLLSQDLVEKYQETGNKQKIYYKLTESGQRIYKIHKKLHDKIQRDKKSIVEKYTEDEQVIILGFLNDINSLIDNTFKDIEKDGNMY
ncbi:MarR family transcriptional regulator [Clostridium beijerinckii]|uniref:MarR family transcriptional regulator n=1 Tax=Clostridium beijerinckii TaxID=1520 RepID=UPI00047D1527|nr:MarR family transcriptional regulator [Clostridium beijerinckii]